MTCRLFDFMDLTNSSYLAYQSISCLSVLFLDIHNDVDEEEQDT